MSDELQIREECARRGITRLCHFTQSRKLAHILAEPEGLRCAEELAEYCPDVLDVNDQSRYDGKDHLNCSVEYPNSWTLRWMLDRDPHFKDWVIIFISPKYLWEPGTEFSTTNAGSYVTQRATGIAGFQALYAHQVRGAKRVWARGPRMLDCCPTDDQAEVLLRGPIPRSDLLGVGVRSADQATVERRHLRIIGVTDPPPFVIAPALFDPFMWSRNVRWGERPVESVFKDESDGD